MQLSNVPNFQTTNQNPSTRSANYSNRLHLRFNRQNPSDHPKKHGIDHFYHQISNVHLNTTLIPHTHHYHRQMETSRQAKRTKLSDESIESNTSVIHANYPTPPIEDCRKPYAEIIASKTRVEWDREAKFTPVGTEPDFTSSPHPSLDFHLHAMSGHARASTLFFPPRPSINRKAPVSVPTPIFMPVGTKGTIKSMSYEELCTVKVSAMRACEIYYYICHNNIQDQPNPLQIPPRPHSPSPPPSS
jgi:hypothetical protein